MLPSCLLPSTFPSTVLNVDETIKEEVGMHFADAFLLSTATCSWQLRSCSVCDTLCQTDAVRLPHTEKCFDTDTKIAPMKNNSITRRILIAWQGQGHNRPAAHRTQATCSRSVCCGRESRLVERCSSSTRVHDFFSVCQACHSFAKTRKLHEDSILLPYTPLSGAWHHHTTRKALRAAILSPQIVRL